jgi:hypothetical protein
MADNSQMQAEIRALRAALAGQKLAITAGTHRDKEAPPLSDDALAAAVPTKAKEKAAPMAANRAESSGQPHSPIPDNNNPPALPPSLRAVHPTPVSTSVFAEGTLLPEPAAEDSGVASPGPLQNQNDRRSRKRRKRSPESSSGVRGLVGNVPRSTHGPPSGGSDSSTNGMTAKESTHGSFEANGTAPSNRLLKRKQVDCALFDALMYAQVGASSPPPNITFPALPATPPPCLPKPTDSTPKQKDEPLYLPIDPHTHWPQSHSAPWHAAKQAEIQARGGRKANFGQAAQRLQRHRRQTTF